MAINDPAPVGDQLEAWRGVAVADASGMNGLVVAERFTPPSNAERRRLVNDLDSTAVWDRLVALQVADRHQLPPRHWRRSLVGALQWAPEYRVELVETENIITQVGDQYYGERASGVAGAPGQVTGMKLGTGAVTGGSLPAKTGSGAALTTYKSGSQKAIDGSYPTSALSVASRRIGWRVSWGAGVINGSALTEAVMVIDVLADATSSAANTIARAAIGPITLGANDTLALSWFHDLLGG